MTEWSEMISAAGLARSLGVSRETVLALAAVVESSPHYTGQPGALTAFRLDLAEDCVWLTEPAARAIRHEIDRDAYNAHADAEFAAHVDSVLTIEAERTSRDLAHDRYRALAEVARDLGQEVTCHWRWPDTTETGCGTVYHTNLFTVREWEVTCLPCRRAVNEWLAGL